MGQFSPHFMIKLLNRGADVFEIFHNDWVAFTLIIVDEGCHVLDKIVIANVHEDVQNHGW